VFSVALRQVVALDPSRIAMHCVIPVTVYAVHHTECAAGDW
jgi:hypothetical protein